MYVSSASTYPWAYLLIHHYTVNEESYDLKLAFAFNTFPILNNVQLSVNRKLYYKAVRAQICYC